MDDHIETQTCPHCGGPDNHRGYGYHGRHYAACLVLYRKLVW